VLQAQHQRAESALKPFRTFFLALAEQVTGAYQTVSSAPLKCTLQNSVNEVVSSEAFTAEGRQYATPRGNLRALVRTDSQFDALSCEICFGGAGAVHKAEDDVHRPSSKIERRLRELIIKEIFGRLPAALQSMTDLQITPVEAEGPAKSQTAATDLHCISVTMLVNAFSLSTEVTCLFPQAELENLLAVQIPAEQRGKRTARQVMMTCPFELTALLPPEQISLSQILALQPGSVLKLSATPSHQLQLKMGNTEIARATFELRSNSVALAIA